MKHDTPVGTLDFRPLRIATSTTGCRHRAVPEQTILRALAPVADVPVLGEVSAVRLNADPTLGPGEVAHDDPAE